MYNKRERKAGYCKREYERNGVERKYPYCDYELKPKSAWNYGFASNALSIEEMPITATPFSSVNPPVILRAKMAPVKWEWADGYDTVPEVKPVSNKAIGVVEEMSLVPYGCAKLRMTEMPQIRK